MKKQVLVILGPTASGKSDLAVRLAKRLKGEVISADSRQVYKGLNVGTGKITKAEMKGIPHHLLDVADPRTVFSVSDYTILTNQAIAKIVKKGKLPIMVGGTGFYIDAVAGTVSLPEVPPNPKLRTTLEKKSPEVLFKLLEKKDPARAKTIDRHNKVRLVRALEIVAALGKVPGTTHNSQPTTYNFKYIGIRPVDLDTRIEKRLLKRLPGMIREAQKLVKLKKLNYKRMHQLGLEYRYLALYLEKKISKEELVTDLNTVIRQYARRQMAWFRRNKKITWYESASDAYAATLSQLARETRPRSR